MNVIADLFPGFAKRRIPTEAAEIFVRTGGSGPPLLLLHGYPQTHVGWHKIAAELARDVTLVLADLRGYGASSAWPGDGEHQTYSKRTMAADCLAVMRAPGHRRFYPWAFLAQPYPLPETRIGREPIYYLEHTLKSWAGRGDLSPFSLEALAHDRALLKDPARLHAVCEDYRAGAGIDGQLDEADLTAGRRIACPTFVLWGSTYLGRGGANPLDVWRTWCTNVTGSAVTAGHVLAEETLQATLAALIPFLKAHGGSR
jgi:haloacetate dehalogenase